MLQLPQDHCEGGMMLKLGRIARDESRYSPVLEDYLRTHPLGMQGLEKVADADDVDRASKVSSYPMYANDSIGDCTIAAMGHIFTALDVYAGWPQVLFSDEEIIRAYSAISGYDPATGANDNGCQMQDVLAYMRSTGMTDMQGNTHKVLMYARLRSPRSPQILSEALKTFGHVYTGIDCPQSAQDDFGKIWTYVPGSSILGGHAIALHRRQPYGSQVGVFDFSTWGALQPTTISFMSHYVEEAWVAVTRDWIAANGDTCDGISLAQLEADMAYV
jgi:hypothetical protein